MEIPIFSLLNVVLGKGQNLIFKHKENGLLLVAMTVIKKLYFFSKGK